jgi:hypothetical protein
MTGMPTAPSEIPACFCMNLGGRVAEQKVLKERQKEDRLLKNI